MFSESMMLSISTLYIPLCLYFNDFRQNYPGIRPVLYIPLCLYFNGKGNGCSDSLSDFTFHYVSILIT